MSAITAASITRRCGPGCPTCADLSRAVIALADREGMAGVTPERLARFAGLPVERLDLHVCGKVEACVADAYGETMEGLQSRYAAQMRAAATRDEALRDATADLFAYLARHPAVASFVAVEVFRGGPELLELREELRRRSVRELARELGRFDGDGSAPEIQGETIVAAIGQTVARHVATGQTRRLPDAVAGVLATGGARESQRAG